MSALIAGIDFSSKAIHAALIPLDPDDGGDAPPVTLRVFEFPSFKAGASTPAYRSVERCRVVREGLRQLLGVVWTASGDAEWEYDHHVAHVCVETPFGSASRSTVLWELYGAILATIPPHIERDTIQTHEWRRLTWGTTGAGREESWKYAAIGRAREDTQLAMSEHHAEAYLIARAARERLHAAVA